MIPVKCTMLENNISTLDIEIVVMEFFGVRQNIIVPNVYWGMGFRHEIDMFVLTKAGYGIEVEIKISRSDMIADTKKKRHHYSEKIKQLYFAVPKTIINSCIEFIPDYAGIITVHKCKNKYYAKKYREAMIKSHYKFSDNERSKLLHLAAMRILTMKKQISKMVKKN